MGARGFSGLMLLRKSFLDRGKIPGLKDYGPCSTASSRQKGMEPPAPDSSTPNTLYAKVVHLCGMWDGRSHHLHCTAQRCARPGQQPRQDSPVQPRPGTGLPQTEVNRR